jgi:hypothetical protein
MMETEAPEVQVALQGTLETFALSDVLRLLASTKKTGILRVDTDRGHGEIQVVDGALGVGSAEQAPRAETPSEVLFEMLRSGVGSFVFDTEATVDTSTDGQDVDAALAEAEAQLTEWTEIAAVVPSPHCGVTLRPTHDGDITLTPEQWRVVAMIGSGCTVAELGDRLEQVELVATRAVRDLVEIDAVAVSAADVAATAASAEPALAPETPSVTPPAPLDPEVAPAPEVDAQSFEADPDSFLASNPTPLPPLPTRQANGHAPSAEEPVAPVAPLFGDPPAEAAAAPAAADPAPAWQPDDFGEESSSFFDDDDEDPLADDPFGPDPFRIPRLPSTDEAQTDSDAAEMARQLSNLSPRAAQAVAAAAAATTDEEREQALAQATEDGEEPVNRGLLLKFLSSVDD